GASGAPHGLAPVALRHGQELLAVGTADLLRLGRGCHGTTTRVFDPQGRGVGLVRVRRPEDSRTGRAPEGEASVRLAECEWLGKVRASHVHHWLGWRLLSCALGLPAVSAVPARFVFTFRTRFPAYGVFTPSKAADPLQDGREVGQPVLWVGRTFAEKPLPARVQFLLLVIVGARRPQ